MLTQPITSLIAIGICREFSHPLELPGCYKGSWRYHSDDGKLFTGKRYTERGLSYGPTYGTNDVVGCGVDYTTNKLFFTKNGQYLGIYSAEFNLTRSVILIPLTGPAIDAPKGRLFAVIGIGGKDVHVSINFGPDGFLYTLPEVASTAP